MRVENEIKTRYIDINSIDFETDYYPSFRILINLKTEELVAEFNRSIWISEADLDKFLIHLENLDASRIGNAELISMSPDEFKIRFSNLDKLGHILVRLQLCKESTIDKSYSDNLQVEFEIDPTSLRHIIDEFKEIKSSS